MQRLCIICHTPITDGAEACEVGRRSKCAESTEYGVQNVYAHFDCLPQRLKPPIVMTREEWYELEDNNPQEAYNLLRRHAFKVLGDAKQAIANEKYDEVETFSSPAGDGYGCDNTCLNFDFGEDILRNTDTGDTADIGDVLEKLKELKEKIRKKSQEKAGKSRKK